MSFFDKLTLLAQQYTAPTSIPQVQANNTTLSNIMNLVYGLAGAIAVVYIVLGGIHYTTSAGDMNKVKKAKDTILYAVIGLVVVIAAFAITNFVVGKF